MREWCGPRGSSQFGFGGLLGSLGAALAKRAKAPVATSENLCFEEQGCQRGQG